MTQPMSPGAVRAQQVGRLARVRARRAAARSGAIAWSSSRCSASARPRAARRSRPAVRVSSGAKARRPAGGDAKLRVAGIVRRRRALDQAALLEAAQQAAQVAGIEAEVARQLGRGGVLAVRELPQQARFGQRERGRQQAFLQHADAPRVEAVEAADRVDRGFRGGGVGHGSGEVGSKPILAQSID